VISRRQPIRRTTLGWLLLWTSALWCAPVAAFEYQIDSDARLGILDMIGSGDWQQGTDSPSFGFRPEAVWLRTDVPPSADVLAIDNGWLDDLEIYFVANHRVVANYHSGYRRPFSERALHTQQFAFPVQRGDGPTRVYVRSLGHGSHYLPLSFMTNEAFQAQASTRALLQGGYYGIIIVMIMYYLVLFAGMRDTVYLYYVAYAASLMIAMLSKDGLGPQFFWPDWPVVQRLASDLGVSLAILFSGLFAIEFLKLKRALPRFHQIALILVGITAFNGLLGALFASYVFPRNNALLVICVTVVFVTAATQRLRQGFRPALIYLIATGSLLVGSTLFVAMLLGWIDDSLIARFGVQLGSTAELMLLAFALSQRMNEEHKKRLWMQHRSLELTREVRALKSGTQIAEEHRLLQRSLQQAQKLRTIGEMTGGFAHDFNNILASVLGFAELAKERAGRLRDHKLADFVDEIERAGLRGADLVKQLLIYSRGGNTEPHEFDLNNTIGETIRFLRGTLPATVQITTEIPERPQPAFADPAHIRQMLVNLALNASEAMNERGEITISLRRAVHDEATCASCAARFSGDHLTLSIADRGHGVPAEVHDLFTPFHTTKPVGQGSGLGLSVVHGIAHEYGGHITVSPRAQGGARFSVHLPPHDARTLPAQGTGNRIMVIDDDRALARYLETLLTGQGFVVTVAHTSSEALEKVMAQPHGFDLVITDQLMPQVTGLELARDIRDVRADLPVILCSGNPDAIDRTTMAHTAIKAVFPKPIESEMLLAKVRGLLAEPAQ
jgi:signal transduction histidine kinase